MSWTISWIGCNFISHWPFYLCNGFYTHPRNILQPTPPQIVCTNIRIEWKTLGCTHFPEICFHLPSIWHEYQDKKKIPEIWFHPPNVWHRYHDRIKNVWFYKHSRICFSTSPIHSQNTRRVQKQKLCFRISVFLFPPCVYNSTFLILSWFLCQTFGGVIKFYCCLWALSGPEGGRHNF